MGRGGQSDPSIRPNEVHRERKFKKVPGSKGFSLSKNTRAPGASDPACPKEVAFPGLYQGLWQNQTLGSQTTGWGMDRTPAHRVGCVWTDQHLRNPSPTSQVLSFEPRQGLSLGPLPFLFIPSPFRTLALTPLQKTLLVFDVCPYSDCKVCTIWNSHKQYKVV